MKIKVKVSCAGKNFSYAMGETVDAPTDIAKDLISGNLAEEVKSASKPKTGGKDNADT